MRRGPKPGTRLTERCDCMALEVSMGGSLRAVAEKHGVSAVAVFKACERRGVLSRRSPRNLASFERQVKTSAR